MVSDLSNNKPVEALYRIRTYHLLTYIRCATICTSNAKQALYHHRAFYIIHILAYGSGTPF